MEDSLRARVVGQDHVVQAVSDAVRISRVGLQAPTRPVASFLFLGPTGVGKVYTIGSSSASLTQQDFFRPNCARPLLDFCSTTSAGHCETLIAFLTLIDIK